MNLFFQFCLNSCDLILFDDQKIIKHTVFKTNKNLTDIFNKKLNLFIANKKIKNLYFLNGPGSFTGIRVSSILAKTLAYFNKLNVYVLDSLTFQLKDLNGISLIDAKSNSQYICIYQNKKCILKPSIKTNSEIKSICQKYLSLKIYRDYKNINFEKNLITLKHKFKRINNVLNIKPLYIKSSLYGNQKN